MEYTSATSTVAKATAHTRFCLGRTVDDYDGAVTDQPANRDVLVPSWDASLGMTGMIGHLTVSNEVYTT
jgi:hypothetical protein